MTESVTRFGEHVHPGDYRTVCAVVEDVTPREGIVDHAFTDPPYAKHVDKNARRGKKSATSISAPMRLGFDAATSDSRRRWARWLAIVVRNWVGVLCDHESSNDWGQHLEAAGLVYVRAALWIRTADKDLERIIGKPTMAGGGAPQFTGDRPKQGHEVLVLAHKGRRMRWSAHGQHGIYVHPIVPRERRVHPTEKPVPLMRDILRDFCLPEHTVIDPFAGAGATLVAARQIGMAGAIGIEKQARYADLATRRAQAAARLTA